MSTRGLYGFYKNGTNKLTYNHSDSYPSYLGQHVIDFIQSCSLSELNHIFDWIILAQEDDKPTPEQIKDCRKYADLDVSTKELTDWYCLLRNTQGELALYRDGLRYMIDNQSFIQDSLFCEWAYIINLDDKVLEIYKGFQTEPQNNRYRIDKPIDPNCSSYYNCKLVRTYPLDDIPKNWLKEFKGE
jgi:hypothetical protein